MAATKTDLMSRADKIKSKLDSGKLKGKQKAKAKMEMYNLRYRANKLKGPKIKATAKKSKRSSVDPNQMILPGFLGQMDVVKIEELFRERLTSALDKRIETVVESVLSKLIPKVG